MWVWPRRRGDPLRGATREKVWSTRCAKSPARGSNGRWTHARATHKSPRRAGPLARRGCQYKRCGTANVFWGVQPKAGRHFTKSTADRCSPEFADYLLEIAASYPEADTIHLVMDNLSTPRRKAVVERFGEKDGGWLWDRLTGHYTPKYGSCLNQAESGS